MKKGDTMKKPSSVGRRIVLVSCMLAVLALATGTYWFFFMRGVVYSDDARIDGDLVDLAPEINGALRQVLVQEGDRVEKGQILFVLDKKYLEASVAQARATLNAARSNLSAQEAGYQKAVHGPRAQDISIARAAVMKLRAQNKLASLQLARTKTLYGKKAASKSELDNVRTTYESNEQSLEEAVQRLELLQVGTRSEDIEAARCKVELAEGQVKKDAAALSRTMITLGKATVHAPFDGSIVRRWRDPGAMVMEGTPILTVLDTASLRVSANIEEKYLNRIRIDDPVDISVDAFPDLELKGHIERILRATNSEFSLIPAEGVSGTFIKVTQRVRLRIAIHDLPDLSLGPGLSVEVRIHTTGNTDKLQGSKIHG
jgi:membrane fusion protein (multidrug efflux system)